MTKRIILLATIVILLLTVWLGSTIYFTFRAISDSNAAARSLATRALLLTSVLGAPDADPVKPPIPYDQPGGQAGILTFSQILEGRLLSVSCGISAPPGLANAEGPYEIAIFTNHAKSWSSPEWAIPVIRNISIYAKNTPINPGDTFSLKDHTELSPSASSLLFIRYKSISVDGKPGQILLGIAVTPDELAFAKSQGANGTADLVQKLKDNGIFPISYLNRNSVVDPSANLVTPLEGRANRQKIDLNTPSEKPRASSLHPAPSTKNNNTKSTPNAKNKSQQPTADDEEDD